MMKQEGFLIESLNTALRIFIANGTPLPKGRGRVIDADALKERFHGVDDAGTFIYIDKLLEFIDNAPTIIEADGEDNNADCD